MKFVRYGPHGDEKPGLIDVNGKVQDLSAQFDNITDEALVPENLAGSAKIDMKTLMVVNGQPQKGFRLEPCVSGTGKTICIGLNYTDLAAETGSPTGAGTGQKPPVYHKGGEVMRLGIDGLGIQTQRFLRASSW